MKPPVTSATVVANPNKPHSMQAKKEVCEFLASRGIKVTDSGAGLFVAIGGDGTILFNKRHFDKPIFAIGGPTSYLCQAGHNDWKGKLEKE